MTKQNIIKAYELDGTEIDTIKNPQATVPIYALLEDTESHHKGWYFHDEVQWAHGPFNTFEEAVEGFKKYMRDLLDPGPDFE